MPDHTITVPCPHVMDDGAPCEADVVVELCYDKGEKPTRDYPGFPALWFIAELKDVCASGHTLTQREWMDTFDEAEKRVKDYRPDVLTPHDEI